MNKDQLQKLFDVAGHETEVRRLVDLIGADRVISIALKHVEDKRARAQKEFDAAVRHAVAAQRAANQKD